ncbi:hypothetical protein MC885_020531 [Smutsia gigantea]|nr:hypothetical protein MC885_020531 [Smutsia gigantea]
MRGFITGRQFLNPDLRNPPILAEPGNAGEPPPAPQNESLGRTSNVAAVVGGQAETLPQAWGPEHGAPGGTLAEPWDVRSRVTAAQKWGPRQKMAKERCLKKLFQDSLEDIKK